MIDIIDPNLNLPQPPASPSVEPVEPIKPETVGIEEERLEDKRHNAQEDTRQRRREKDKVEISQLEGAGGDEDTPEEEQDTPEDETDDGSINILI